MVGYGRVRWTLISEDGKEIHLLIPCHHVPGSSIRLLSPQDFCQSIGLDRSKDQFGGNSSYFWMKMDHDAGTRFQCPIDPHSNLPVALAKVPLRCEDSGDGCGDSVDHMASPVANQPIRPLYRVLLFVPHVLVSLCFQFLMKQIRTSQLPRNLRSILGIVSPVSHDNIFLHSLDWDGPFRGGYTALAAQNSLHVDPLTNETEWFHPFTLGAKASNDDTPTLRHIRSLPHRELDLWYDSMDLELMEELFGRFFVLR